METRALAIAFFYAIGTAVRRNHRPAAAEGEPDEELTAEEMGPPRDEDSARHAAQERIRARRERR